MKQGTIDTAVDPTRDLLINTVSGAPELDDYLAALRLNLDRTPESHVIWDYSDADVSQIGTAHLKRILEFILAHPNGRVVKRVALVVPADLAYGLGRMMETFSDMHKAPWIMKLFRDLEAARVWIGNPDQDAGPPP